MPKRTWCRPADKQSECCEISGAHGGQYGDDSHLGYGAEQSPKVNDVSEVCTVSIIRVMMEG
jgi:hypothetical protein